MHKNKIDEYRKLQQEKDRLADSMKVVEMQIQAIEREYEIRKQEILGFRWFYAG